MRLRRRAEEDGEKVESESEQLLELSLSDSSLEDSGSLSLSEEEEEDGGVGGCLGSSVVARNQPPSGISDRSRLKCLGLR